MAKPRTTAQLGVSVNGLTVVAMTAGTRVAPGARFASWTILWGDGMASGGQGAVPPTVPHTYALPGSYTIALTVLDTKRASSSDQETVQVMIVNVGSEVDYGGYRPQLHTSMGMNTVGGRGVGPTPKIIRVTTLADTGAALSGPAGDGTYSGEFRAALTTAGPRFVIFDISGTITLLTPLVITQPYITIAGQTAPNPGIQIKGYGIQASQQHAVIQHIRIRPGDGDPGTFSGSIACESWGANSQDQVWDHVTAGWSVDETFAPGPSAARITYWRSLVHEPLDNPTRAPGEDGKFCLVYQGGRDIAIIGCLSHSSADRSIYAKGDTTSYMANVIVSNPGGENTLYADPDTSGLLLATCRSNQYRKGPSTDLGVYWLTRSRYMQSGSKLYLNDLLNDGAPQYDTEFYVIGGDGIDPRVGSEPVSIPGYTPVASSGLMSWMLPRVGARPANRDSHESRTITEVQNRQGAIIDDEATVGGYETYAENTQSLVIPSNPFNVADSVGRTVLEHWLEDYARAVEGT